MAKRAMISQPMNGKSTAEIIETRNRAFQWLQKNGFTVENTFFNDKEHENSELVKQGVQHNAVFFLGKSIEAMSKVDTVYFCRGWDKARGCQAEHFIAKSYGLKVLYED